MKEDALHGHTGTNNAAPPTLTKTLAKREALGGIALEHNKHIKPPERLAISTSDRVGTAAAFFLIHL